MNPIMKCLICVNFSLNYTIQFSYKIYGESCLKKKKQKFRGTKNKS